MTAGCLTGFTAEDVDDLHGLRDVQQARVTALAQELRVARFDRVDPVARVHQIHGHMVGWALPLGRAADHGHRLELEDILDVAVGIGHPKGLSGPAGPGARFDGSKLVITAAI